MPNDFSTINCKIFSLSRRQLILLMVHWLAPQGFLLYGRCSSLSSSHGSCVMAEQMLEPRAIRFLPGGYILGQRKQGKGMLELQVTSPSFTGLFLCYTFELTSCLRTTRMNRNSSCPQINPHDAVKRARGLATPMKGSSSRLIKKNANENETEDHTISLEAV